MQQTHVEGKRYLIGSGGGLPKHDPADLIRDRISVANVLRRCADNTHEMRMLRTLVAAAHRTEYVTAQSDVAVVELAVRLVCHGRLRLLKLVKDRVVSGVPEDPPAASAPPTRSQSAAPARAAEVQVVPSFSAQLDAGALAAALLAASEDGTPFCEECARAAAAA